MKLTIEGDLEEIKKVLQAIASSEEHFDENMDEESEKIGFKNQLTFRWKWIMSMTVTTLNFTVFTNACKIADALEISLDELRKDDENEY